MKIHVETRSLANNVQILNTLIGQIISKLTKDAESDINVKMFCVHKFTLNHVLELCTCFGPKIITKMQLVHFLVTGSLKMHLKLI